jgi:hypothetical protein
MSHDPNLLNVLRYIDMAIAAIVAFLLGLFIVSLFR